MTRRSVIRQPNCLNTVRLLAAVLVVIGHVYLRMDVQLPGWCVWLVQYFRGVPIFFVLSGFLIWNSIEDSTPEQYAKKRFLRIYPELWCAVLVGILAMLPLLDVPVRWGKLGLFAVTQGTVLQFWTPDFLRSYGCGTPNGALWTVGVTVQFYVVVWFAFRLLRDKKLWVWLSCQAALIAINLGLPMLQTVVPTLVYKLILQTLLPYAWLFFLGALVAQFCEKLLPWLRKWWPLLLLLAAGVKLLGIDAGTHYGVLHGMLMTTGMIGMAYALPKLNIAIDLSYGIYVYHMIVVNIMIELDLVRKPVYLLPVLGVSGLLALVSRLTIGRIKIGKYKKAGECA